MPSSFTGLSEAIRTELDKLPRPMVQETVIRQSIIHVLAQALTGMGLIPVPAWKPPLSTRDCIDLVGVKPGSEPPEIQVAFAVDPLVELPKIKALEWVECPDKVVVSFSERVDKIQPTTFFLSKEHEHIILHA